MSLSLKQTKGNSVFTGATSVLAGTSGLVPIPVAGEQDSF